MSYATLNMNVKEIVSQWPSFIKRWYMAQKYTSSVANHWYPADLQQQAQVNEYLAWQHTNTRANGSKVFLLKVQVPDQTVVAVSSSDLHYYRCLSNSDIRSFVCFVPFCSTRMTSLSMLYILCRHCYVVHHVQHLNVSTVILLVVLYEKLEDHHSQWATSSGTMYVSSKSHSCCL